MSGQRLHWVGTGPRLLLLPGWNTPGLGLEEAIPRWFLEKWCCGVLEWPGMGRRGAEASPGHMDDLVAEIGMALAEGPVVGVVGFCLGGVAAWEHTRRSSQPLPLVLVESPYHFPLVLAPLLIPTIGPWLFRTFTQTRAGRACVERGLFGKTRVLPSGFWKLFGGTRPATAQAYLELLKRYERDLPVCPVQPRRLCKRIKGGNSPRLLGWRWGRNHTIRAEEHTLEGVGHFPASEAPDRFFRLLDRVLDLDLGRGCPQGSQELSIGAMAAEPKDQGDATPEGNQNYPGQG